MLRVSQQDVDEALNDLGVVEGDRLFVHSSVMAFGLPTEGIQTFLLPLLEHIGNTGTLAAPTFSFSFIKTGQYDVEKTPSAGMGALSEAIRRHPSALRTAHPIQSFAAIGPLATQLCALRTDSAYGQGSAMEALTELDFKVLLLGAEPIHISLSHLSEERANVPYRFVKKVEGTARLVAGEAPVTGVWNFFARYLELPIFPEKEDAIVDELAAEGRWFDAVLNGVKVSVGGAKDFCDRLDGYLTQNPYWMLPDPAPVRAFCEGLQRS